MAKVTKVEISTDDGMVRTWTGTAAVRWAKYMVSRYGSDATPAPSSVTTPNHSPKEIKKLPGGQSYKKLLRWIALARGALVGAAASPEHAAKILGMLAHQSRCFPCVEDERLAHQYAEAERRMAQLAKQSKP